MSINKQVRLEALLKRAKRIYPSHLKRNSIVNLNVEDLLGSHEKLIMDPVHGGIAISRREVAIIDHALFQRLRFICQNDILSLVFPGATHSRFLHSIGAMHVGGRMFMAMVENGLKLAAKTLNNHQIRSETLEAISYFHRIVRCACLLHDSGHSSFSHQFSRTDTIQKLLGEKDLFKELWAGIDARFAYPETPSFLEHEHYSIRIAHEILEDIANNHPHINEDGIIMRDILALMETADIAPSQSFETHAQNLWPIMQQDLERRLPEKFGFKVRDMLSLIVSGELDADRADYMLRDGFHSSVTIGGFNLDHLLSNLSFGLCEQTGWVGMAIADKGLSSLEDFVYSRHQMYRQVYAHKTAQGFDWLLRAAINEVMLDPKTDKFVKMSLRDVQQFKNLSDNYFWEAFRCYAETRTHSYSRCILERIKMPHLATRVNLSKNEESTYRQFLADEQHVPVDTIIVSSITARFTRIRDQFSEIKVLKKDSNGNVTYKLIAKTSRFFDKFSDDRIIHFYTDPCAK